MNILRVNLEFSYMLLEEHYEKQEALPYVLSEMFYPLLKKLILSRLSQKLLFTTGCLSYNAL